MFRGLSRPLGVLLLAVLAVTPVARVLCALECRAERTAHTSAPDSAEPTSHCARPAADAGLATLNLRGFPDCAGCKATFGTEQATLRVEAKGPLAGLAQAMPSPAADEVAAPAGAAAVRLPGSPPLRAPYPLRI
jgi:hypothetical protein